MKITKIEPNGWVWMWYFERSDYAIQVGIGPLLIWKWRDQPWWRWEFTLNPD